MVRGSAIAIHLASVSTRLAVRKKSFADAVRRIVPRRTRRRGRSPATGRLPAGVRTPGMQGVAGLVAGVVGLGVLRGVLPEPWSSRTAGSTGSPPA